MPTETIYGGHFGFGKKRVAHIRRIDSKPDTTRNLGHLTDNCAPG